MSNLLDKHRHLEYDVIILGQMTDLAKTITIPHHVCFYLFIFINKFLFYSN